MASDRAEENRHISLGVHTHPALEHAAPTEPAPTLDDIYQTGEKNPKRVLILNTGGTMVMKFTKKFGYVPAPYFLEQIMAKLAEFQAAIVPQYEILQYDPLLDSADMRPEDWIRIARDIESHYNKFDGFVVVHGTDTMAYTGSALSFMLENLTKTVVLTGAQISFSNVRNDARDNLLTSLLIASDSHIPEVVIYFNNTLLRANRTTKVNAWALNAFASGNFPPLATVGIDVRINSHLVLRPPFGSDGQPIAAFRAQTRLETDIGCLRLFPAMSVGVLRSFLWSPLKGIVLEAYGTGTMTATKTEFIRAMREATDRGVVIVVTTQCHTGSVDLDLYGAGKALLEAGVISGFDMTAEAALTKLCYLFGKGYDSKEVKRLMQENLRGELSKNMDVVLAFNQPMRFSAHL